MVHVRVIGGLYWNGSNRFFERIQDILKLNNKNNFVSKFTGPLGFLPTS